MLDGVLAEPNEALQEELDVGVLTGDDEPNEWHFCPEEVSWEYLQVLCGVYELGEVYGGLDVR